MKELISVSQLSKSQPTLKFGLASTNIQRKKIYQLRKEVYEKLSWNHLVEKDKWDAHAYLFFLELEENIIATCRVIQINQNKDFLKAALKFTPDLKIASSVVIERLLLHENFRDCTLYKKLLSTACHWVKSNTASTMWYAKCTPILTRIYLKFGAKVIGFEKQPITKTQSRNYQYLKGSISETLTANSKFVISY